MNEENLSEKNNDKSGYIISVTAGCIASGIISGWGLASMLGGLLAVLLFGGIISSVIYLFYRKNFQTIFTIVCVIFSILAALGGSGVRLF